jgi:hypothetical protein
MTVILFTSPSLLLLAFVRLIDRFFRLLVRAIFALRGDGFVFFFSSGFRLFSGSVFSLFFNFRRRFVFFSSGFRGLCGFFGSRRLRSIFSGRRFSTCRLGYWGIGYRGRSFSLCGSGGP